MFEIEPLGDRGCQLTRSLHRILKASEVVLIPVILPSPETTATLNFDLRARGTEKLLFENSISSCETLLVEIACRLLEAGAYPKDSRCNISG